MPSPDKNISNELNDKTPSLPPHCIDSNLNEILSLGPETIRTFLKYFVTLTQVPRPSYFEELVVESVLKPYAKEFGYQLAVDDAGNVGIFVPGRGKGANSNEAIVLQSHLDMVGNASFPVPDDYFQNNPIKPVVAQREVDGLGVVDVITATETTLGADDGYGVAASLAMGEPDAVKDADPMLLLFTVREEIGDQSAMHLDASKFQFDKEVIYKHLINLDSGDGPAIRIGGVGTTNIDFRWEPKRSLPTENQTALKLLISGAKGGHSGRLIGSQHVNPIKALARILNDDAVSDHFQLGAFERPESPAGLATKAEATIWVDKKDQELVTKKLQALFRAADFTDFEENLAFNIESVEEVAEFKNPIEKAIGAEIIRVIETIPHGPYGPKGAPSYFTPHELVGEIVATSNNFRNVVTRADRHGTIAVTLYPRSFIDSDLHELENEIEELLDSTSVVAANPEADESKKSSISNVKPAWTPRTKSELFSSVLEAMRAAYTESNISVIAPTSSVEAGTCARRLGILNAVAFGPIVGDLHEPGEYMVIDTLPPFIDTLKYSIELICNSK